MSSSSAASSSSLGISANSMIDAGSSSSGGGSNYRNVESGEMQMMSISVASFEHEKTSAVSEKNHRMANFATTASWFVNIFLFVAKIVCVLLSGSKSVWAALADSAVDLFSQALLSLAEAYMNKHSPNYPVGRSRLEAISVLACSFVMTTASLGIIVFSGIDLYDGFKGKLPFIDIGPAVYALLSVGIASKVFLYVFCTWAQKILSSDILSALAEDHLNDIFSNITAIITASIAFNYRNAWYIDPIGAIFISVVIIYRWLTIIEEQVQKIVGHTAPQEFIEELEKLVVDHESRIKLDCIRAYHFGSRFNVEVEIILPADMTVRESHDMALALQHKIEENEDVERAFVHVDYLERDGLEHKVERLLVKGTPDSTSDDIRSRGSK